MPTYQYACTLCAEQLEAVQRFTDDPLTVCPACGGTLRKVYSPVGIVFKGSGFYRTDSRNGSRPGGDSEKANGAAEKTDKTDKKASPDGGSSSSGAGKPDAGKPAAAKSSQPAGAGSSS